MTPLKEIYKKGSIRFIKELTISRESLPENAHLKYILDYFPYKNDIYVPDYFVNEIKVFSTEGKFLRTIGRSGQGPGDLIRPGPVVCDGDQFFVWENGNRRISVFTLKGEFIKHIRMQNKFQIKSIGILDNKSIVVERFPIRWNGEDLEQYFTLEHYSPDFTLRKEIYRENIKKYLPKEPQKNLILLPYPEMVMYCILPGNRIAIARSGKYEIKISTLESGKEIKTISRKNTTIKVTDRDKKTFLESLDQQLPQGKRVKENTLFPDFKPAIKYIMSDCDGNILVFPYTKKRYPGLVQKADCFDAFDQEGNFIAHVKIAPGMEISLFKTVSSKGNIFWVLSDPEDEGDTKVIKYKVN